MVYIHLFSPHLLYILQALFDNGERDQSQEVHLDKSHRLHDMPVVLRYQHPLMKLIVVYARQGSELSQVVCTNNHTAGVHTHLPYCVLQLCRIVQCFAYDGLSLLIFLL